MFKKKIRCPYCRNELIKKPTRITECPYCSQPIYYRYDELCTEDEAQKMDWREHSLVIFTLVKHE